MRFTTNNNISKGRMRAMLATMVAILCLCMCTLQVHAFSPNTFAGSSKLASGKWVRVKVESDGMYRITPDDIVRWGFSRSDWAAIRVHGYGGAPISDALTLESIIDDLPATPVIRTDGAIIFYGKSHESWSKSSGAHQYTMEQHPYATAGYYFITANADLPEATPAQSSISQIPETLATTFTERLHYEKELTSPGGTGRLLVGEDFRYTKSRNFTFKLAGIAPGGTATVRTRFMSKLTGATGKLALSYNGTRLSASSANTLNTVSDTEHQHCVAADIITSITPEGESMTWGLEFSAGGTAYLAALDYISVNYTRALSFGGSPLQFRGNSPGYSLSGADAAVTVMDVTSPLNPVEMLTVPSGSELTFAAMYSGEREYIAFSKSSLKSLPAPTMVEAVAAQNIHAEPVPDMVIITPEEYISQARRLASLHETHDGFRCLVLTEQQIFNEFSSGTPDLNGIRHMLKMFYDRPDSEGHALGYVTLFARGTYDNRGVTDKIGKLSYPRIITWQSPDGTNENDSYCTDDVYGMLADGAGANVRSAKILVAPGRFPVRSLQQAREVVDKLETYMENRHTGAWKNNILTIADDEDNAEHMVQADSLINRAKKNVTADGFLFNRLYIDAFTAESNGTKRTYPLARKKLFERFAEGTLWASYIGHANPQGWTHDGLLTTTDINENFFYRKLPFLYTATCEFTRWDADEISGGELMFLNPSGGTVAMISTVRLALIYNNGILSRHIGQQILTKEKGRDYQRVGDILRNAKNNYSGPDENKLKYSLIGDPALRLTFPTHKVVVESINGVNLEDCEDFPVLQAGGEVIVAGAVYTPDGELAQDFNGTVTPRLYDAETSVTTNGYGKYGKEHLYYEHSNLLYLGEDSVCGGRFTLRFRIPQDIANNYSPALLNMYACSSTGAEGNGSTSRLYVYGYCDSIDSDINAPVIETLAVNGMQSGAVVNENPLVTASFTDDSGINLSTAAIGHQMTLVLDEKTVYDDVVYKYTPAVGECGGTIAYELSGLAAGEHTLRFKVWDVANNSADKSITFTVQPGLAPELVDVYAMNDPAAGVMQFYVRHNRPDAYLDVVVEVFDLMGRTVWSGTRSGRSDMYTAMPLTWDFSDNAGRRVPRGIYLYRASVISDSGVASASKSKKIAVAAP